jgi:signal transduction histidine kinase
MPTRIRSSTRGLEVRESELAVWQRTLGDAPDGFAITRGPGHVLVFANDAFLIPFGADRGSVVGVPLAENAGPYAQMLALLDRVFHDQVICRDEPVGGTPGRDAPWSCTVWPLREEDGDAVSGLVIEVLGCDRESSITALQRSIAERLLLAALGERDSAEQARASQLWATFLAGETGRLAESIDEATTRRSVAGLHLGSAAAWCIVDLVEAGGSTRRLAVVHPDPERQAALRAYFAGSKPHRDEAFGIEAVRRAGGPVTLNENVCAALGLNPSDPCGYLLTVPMRIGERLYGALSFVGSEAGRGFSPEEIEVSTVLGTHAAVALENSRLYGEALTLRAEAQRANQSKSDFIAQVSHELRTPLNAMVGYVDLIEGGVYGPVNPEQHTALLRIVASQKQLMRMIDDLMSFVQMQSGRIQIVTTEFAVDEFASATFAMLQSTLDAKRLRSRGVKSPAGVSVRADRERTAQILINLLGNAFKFTPTGGEIGIDVETDGDHVLIHVTDTGAGVPAAHLDAIFEPFVQVAGAEKPSGGVGLGLAISRDLARVMGGDLTVESELGIGSRFTLRLPRAENH